MNPTNTPIKEIIYKKNQNWDKFRNLIRVFFLKNHPISGKETSYSNPKTSKYVYCFYSKKTWYQISTLIKKKDDLCSRTPIRKPKLCTKLTMLKNEAFSIQREDNTRRMRFHFIWYNCEDKLETSGECNLWKRMLCTMFEYKILGKISAN